MFKSKHQEPKAGKPRCCGDCTFLVTLGLHCSAHNCWRAENSPPCSFGKLREGLDVAGKDK